MVLALLGFAFGPGGASHPDQANAYIGESLVQGAGTLTKGAENLIKNPGELPELIKKAGSWGGVAEESKVAGIFSASRAIPAIGGSWLSFETGKGVGKEICNMFGLGWCMSQESTEANPAPGTTGSQSWEFVESNVCGTSISWVWKWGALPCGQSFFGMDGNLAVCGVASPAGGFYVQTQSGKLCGTGEKHGEYTFGGGFIYRYSMQNRTVGWSPSDTSLPNLTYSQPKTWPENLSKELTASPQGERVGQQIAHQLSPGTVDSPYRVKFPSGVCKEGLKVGPCVTALKELDLVPDVKELDWEEAVVEELDELDPEKTREEESEKIIVLPPLPAEVETGTPIEIESNPKKGDMPIWLPLPDKGGGDGGEGEDEEEYKKRIAPIFIPVPGTLDDGTIDPEVGPGRVSRTVPGSRHRFDPHPSPETKPEVKIQSNPDTAPQTGGVPAGGFGGWTPPAIPAVDPGPLEGLKSACSSFPFGLLCWVGAGFEQFNTGGKCPETIIPVPNVGGGTTDFDVGFCNSTAETVLGIFRPAVLFAWIIGLGFLFARATKAIGGGDGD